MSGRARRGSRCAGRRHRSRRRGRAWRRAPSACSLREAASGIAGDGEEASEHRLLSPDRLGSPDARRLFEEAVGDFAGAAPADRVDAGDREQVLDQRPGAGVVGALERRQHAGLGERALSAAVEDRLERVARARAHAAAGAARPRAGASAASTPSNSRASPSRTVERAGAGRRGRLQRERENFGVGGLDVARARSSRGPVWIISPRLARRGRGRPVRDRRYCARSRPPCGEARWARQTGIVYSGRRQSSAPEASRGQVEAAADFLAGHVEKHRRRLQNRRFDALESRRRENGRAPLAGGRPTPGVAGLDWQNGSTFTGIFLEFALVFNKAGGGRSPFPAPR